MPRPTKLKVFRTPIGFHDAYVATPTKKAAIEAWGTDKNIFARGEAEEVTDPALTAEPLASPGAVIKRLRGTAEEQIAALGPSKPRQQSRKAEATPNTKSEKPKPKPSRSAVESAEKQVALAKARQAEELKRISEQEAALAQERRSLQKSHAAEMERLVREQEKAGRAYQEAMRRWRD
ncbi:MAG TPA: hypothetical protein VNT77_04940 [Allosphingosinicella sp.]|nr:hypothetical protein [Allosphingosinicella sp.]